MNKKLKKISNYENFDDWVADLIRQEPDGIDNYMKTSFEEFFRDGNEKALLIALKQIAKAKKMGLSELASKTGVKRESLSRSLSNRGNPRLSTLALVIKALGYKLSLRPIHHAS